MTANTTLLLPVASAPRYCSVWVLALSVPQLVGWGCLYYAFALLIGPMAGELQLSHLQLTGAFSFGLLIEGVMAYPVGQLLDRGKARSIMATGSLLAALGLWYLAQAHNLLQVYLAWGILGVAMSMTLYNASFAVARLRFPAQSRQAIITLSVLGGLASTVFIPLVAWMVQHLGWRQTTEILALLQLLLCLPLHAILLGVPSTSTVVKSQVLSLPLAELKSLLRSRRYLQLSAFIILMTTVSAALPVHLVSILRAFHIDEAWAILVPASMGLFQVTSRVLLYFFEQRLDVHLANRIIPQLIPLALLMLLIAAMGVPEFAIVFTLAFVLLFGMGNGMLTIVKGTAMAEYVSPTQASALNGALGVPLALARASAPLVLAALWSSNWGYGLGLASLFVISILGVAALWLAQGSCSAHNDRPIPPH